MVVVDEMNASLREAGELVQTIQSGLMAERDVKGELGEIAAGRLTGRTSPSDITLFKSVGNAIQDVASAAFVVQVAEQDGLGTAVPL